MTTNENAPAGPSTGEGDALSGSRFQQVLELHRQSTAGQPSGNPKAQLFPHGSGPLRLGDLTDAERRHIEAAELLRQAERAVR